jgi:hypothetical protein
MQCNRTALFLIVSFDRLTVKNVQMLIRYKLFFLLFPCIGSDSRKVTIPFYPYLCAQLKKVVKCVYLGATLGYLLTITSHIFRYI